MELTLSLHAKIGVTDAGLDHGGPRPQHQEGIAAFAWKSGFKLQDEVGEVPVAVSDPLDQLRPRVHSLQRPGADAVLPRRQNPKAVIPQHSGKFGRLFQVMVLRQSLKRLHALGELRRGLFL